MYGKSLPFRSAGQNGHNGLPDFRQIVITFVLGTRIFFLILSLTLSLYEIAIGTDAIEIELKDIEQSLKRHH